MTNSNSKQWSSANPGYIIFLVDQSNSMNEIYTDGVKKSVFTASVINRTIYELVNTNMDGASVKDRVFISIIGYGAGGNTVDEIRSDYLSKFAENPIRVEKKKQKVPDGNGGLAELEIEQPIYIEPVAEGFTPMGEAFMHAKNLIEIWLKTKPNDPAPIIINISDGIPYSGNVYNDNTEDVSLAINVANQIMKISTTDGNPLIFNAHIGVDGGTEYKFAESEQEVNSEEAKFLFKISSTIPEAYKQAAKKHDLVVKDSSRGFVSNAEPTTLIQFINFGSSGGTDKRN